MSLVTNADRLWSATHAEIMAGETADIYFERTQTLLAQRGIAGVPVVAEIFSRASGVLAGVSDVIHLLRGKVEQLEGLQDGDTFLPKEVLFRIKGDYRQFGLYETAVLGALAQSSGWATASKHCAKAAGGRPYFSFGARHVHPAVASVLDVAARLGGAAGVSSILGAKLLAEAAVGTVPHAAVLIVGDTLETARTLVQVSDPGERSILVDTFQDEAVEAVRLAEALGHDLDGIRLDTASERGGVTPDLVKEVRKRLDLRGFTHVRIFCSGNITPERMGLLVEAGADAFGVGSYITQAPPIDMTMDIKEVNGVAVAKRGRIPGITQTNRLKPLF